MPSQSELRSMSMRRLSLLALKGFNVWYEDPENKILFNATLGSIITHLKLRRAVKKQNLAKVVAHSISALIYGAVGFAIRLRQIDRKKMEALQKSAIYMENGKSRAENADAVASIAQQFHETYERLAPSYGYRTRLESAKPWDQIPFSNQSLMKATVQALLRKGVIR
jgi:hypothetical protein